VGFIAYIKVKYIKIVEQKLEGKMEVNFCEVLISYLKWQNIIKNRL
jgi:hypothetical protein